MIRLRAGQFFGETQRVTRFGPFAVTRSRYRAAAVLPRHYHDVPYLYVMLVGGIRERAQLRDNSCTRGWLVFNEVGEAHQDQVFECGAEGLNIEISADWLPALRDVAQVRVPVQYQHAGPAVTAIGALELALRAPDPLQSLGVEEAICSLIETVCTPARSRGRAGAWLSQAEEWIRGRRGCNLCLGDVARAAGVHPAHLCREFRRVYGCTLTQYASRLRADWALNELIHSDAPLAEVAGRAGYADQAHLTRAIRDYFGTTPGKLRRECL